jgi:putative addiction module component (TIGR02574 family)
MLQRQWGMLKGPASKRIVLQSVVAKGPSAMSKRGAQVLEEALTLSPVERAELADRLLASLDSGPDRTIDALWAQEAEDRLDAFERGEIKAVSSRAAFEAIEKVKP